MATYKGNERRKFNRVKLNATVVYCKDEFLNKELKVAYREKEARLIDIGEGGMAFTTDMDLPDSTVLWLKFSISTEEAGVVNFFGMFELKGEVRYKIPLSKNSFRVGVSFLKIDEKSKKEINNFIDVMKAQLNEV